MTNLLVERIGWTLIHFTWEGLGVALLLAIALLLTRRCRAVVRYGISCFALVLLAALPIATFWATAPLEPVVVSRQTARGIEKVAVMPSEAAVRPIDVVVQPYLPGLVLGWGFGASLLAIRLIGGLAQVERLRRRGKPAPNEWQIRFHSAIQKLGLRRKVRLIESPHITVPCAIGVFRAVVIIPTEMLTRLPANYIEALMLHELAHVRRHDYFVNLLQSILETVLFYHPAVWWVSKVVRNEREHCCDDIAVRVLGDPVIYANALTCLEEQRAALPRFSLAANGGSLLSRIQRLFGIQLPTRFAHSAWPIAVVLALTLSATSAAVQAQPAKHKPAVTKKKATKKKKSKAAKPGPTAKAAIAPPPAIRAAGSPIAVPALPPSSLRSAFAVRTVGTSIPARADAVRMLTPDGTMIASPNSGAKLIPASGQSLPTPVAESAPTRAAGVPPANSDTIVTSHPSDGNFRPIEIQPGPDGQMNLTLQQASAREAMLQIALYNYVPLVISPGEDRAVNLYLPKVTLDGSLAEICKVTGWSLRKEGEKFYVDTRSDTVRNAATDLATAAPHPDHITFNFDGVEMRAAAMQLAKASGRSIVVTPGKYAPISASLSDVHFDVALAALCKAAQATYSSEANVIYIEPKAK